MSKGVKKIKWNGKGTVFSNLSVPDSKVIIAPDQFVYFQIAEWLPDTTPEDKKKNITWIRQSANKRIDFHKMLIPAANAYGFKIAKKQCGSFCYYIEASMSSFKDDKNSTGLLVGGHCTPNIVLSTWVLDTPGNDTQITSGNPVIYGQALKLHLETEGLNGTKCTIRIFNAAVGTDQQLRKTYTVDCISGEIDLHISAMDTMAWYNEIGLKRPKEQFYIKVSIAGSQEFVKDSKGQDKHATHLFINNKLGTIIQSVLPAPTNKPAKIGEANISNIEWGCKFTAITLTDRDKFVTVFDEKNPLSFGKSSTKFVFNLRIYYDTDQSDIRADAKPIMDNLVKFLKLNPKLPLLIESYTDERKDNAYNLDLSEKRADGILSYLNTHGVTNKLDAKWYGEEQATHFPLESRKDNEVYKLDRFTKLTFFTPSLKAISYNTVVPTIDIPTVLDIRVKGFEIKQCMLKSDPAKKHDDKIAKYVELTNEGAARTVAKDMPINGGALKLTVFSDITPMLPIILPPIRTISPNRFALSINSCSYFPDKTKPTLIINAFPDALWIFHASYDYDKDYFFKKNGVEQKVSIVKGIDTLYEKFKVYIDMYIKAMKYLPMFNLTGYVQEWLINYIKEEAKLYGLGYHKRWNWAGGPFNGFAKQTDYTEEHKLITETAILTLTILTVIVEVLIVILTEGKAAETKFPQIKKAIRLGKEIKNKKEELEKLGFEFIFPKIAFNRGLYFEKGSDGNVYYIVEDNVSASPLLAIKYEKKFKLADILTEGIYKKDPKTAPKQTDEEKASEKKEKGEVKSSIQNLLDKAGTDAQLTLSFEGRIEAEFQLKMAIPMTANTGKQKITVLNLLNSSLSNSAGKVIGTDSIKAKLNLEAKGKVVTQTWKPLEKIIPSVSLEASLKAKLEGYISHTRTYGFDAKKGPYYKDQIYFSGIKGSVTVAAKLKVNDISVYDDNPTDSPIDFILFGPQYVDVANVQLY